MNYKKCMLIFHKKYFATFFSSLQYTHFSKIMNRKNIYISRYKILILSYNSYCQENINKNNKEQYDSLSTEEKINQIIKSISQYMNITCFTIWNNSFSL